MNVLYVSQDKHDDTSMCPGSLVCLSIVEKLPDEIISVQNADILRRTTSDLPEWLDGTPILINEDEGVPYRGKDAIVKLQTILRSLPPPSRSRSESTPESKQLSKPIKSRKTSEISAEPQKETLDDHFTMDVVVSEETKSDKITEQDLQRYMEMRNSSPASAQPSQNQGGSAQ